MKWYQLHLSTLLTLTLIMACLTALWHRWEPWVLYRTCVVPNDWDFDISLDNAYFASMRDGVCTVFDLRSERTVLSIDYLVGGVRFTDDGRHLAVFKKNAPDNLSVEIHSLINADEMRVVKTSEYSYKARFLRGGSSLLIGDRILLNLKSGTVETKLWEGGVNATVFDEAEIRASQERHAASVARSKLATTLNDFTKIIVPRQCVISENARYACTSLAYTGYIAVWDLETGSKVADLQWETSDEPHLEAVSCSGRYVVLHSSKVSIRIVDIETKSFIGIGPYGSSASFKFATSADTLLGTDSSSVTITRMPSGAHTEIKVSDVMNASLSPDGGRIAISSMGINDRQEAHIYDTTTGQHLTALPAPEGRSLDYLEFTDNDTLCTSDTAYGWLIWKRRRSEGLFGTLELPETWILLIASAMVMVQFGRWLYLIRRRSKP